MKRVDSEWRNQWGTAKPYTRHKTGDETSRCPHSDDPDYNKCSCPKWLFEYKIGDKPKRYSLNTPSWAEAKREATRVLDGFNPEIAVARKEKKAKEEKRTTVDAAIKMWLDRTVSKFGADAAIVKQYRSTFGWRDDKGNARGNMLRYIEHFNKSHAQKVEYIQDITPIFCQQWQDSWTEYSAATRKQRWGTVRSFFNFLHKLGVIEANPAELIKATKERDVFAHVPYTDEQYKRILAKADTYVDTRVKNGAREVHCRRSHVFLELLRHSGADLGDAITFQPSMLTTKIVDSKKVEVFRYIRSKTKIEAVVVIPSELAQSLRSVPPTPDTVPDRPFRYKGNLKTSDVHNWGRRIQKLVSLAKIGKIQLVGRDGTPAIDERGNPIMRSPDVKMLRHTFAVAQLLKGQRPETVAKQLGHVDATMIYRHYGPWCKARDEQHIREQM